MWRQAEVLAVAVLLVVLLGVGVVGRRQAGGGDQGDFRLSTANSGPNGARAFALTLAQLGVSVEEWRRPFFGAGDRLPLEPRTVVAVLAPSRPLTLTEGRELASYVLRGGHLLLVGGGANAAAVCFGWRTHLEDVGAEGDSRIVQLADAPPAHSVLAPMLPESLATLGTVDEVSCDPVPLVRTDTLLSVPSAAPVAMRVTGGAGGSATVVAEPGLFANRALRDTDVGPWVLGALLAAHPARVLVSEYHHGYAEGGSLIGVTLSWLGQAPLGHALLQLGAVGLAALVLAGVRFGPAAPALARRRRSALEHVDALAMGLAAARGAALAASLMVSELRRRLSRAGRPAQGDHRDWLVTLARTLPAGRGGRAASELAELVGREAATPGDLVRTSLLVEDLWEALHRN